MVTFMVVSYWKSIIWTMIVYLNNRSRYFLGLGVVISNYPTLLLVLVGVQPSVDSQVLGQLHFCHVEEPRPAFLELHRVFIWVFYFFVVNNSHRVTKFLFQKNSKITFWKWIFKACMLFQKLHHVSKHCPMIIFNILCCWLGVSPWHVHGNKWTFFLSFHLPITRRPTHMCYPLCQFIGYPISWFLTIHIKGRIYGHLEELAMIILFVKKLCLKLNATMHFQSCIELLMVAH